MYPIFTILSPGGNRNNLVLGYQYFYIFANNIFKRFFISGFNKSLEFVENKSYIKPLEIDNDENNMKSPSV